MSTGIYLIGVHSSPSDVSDANLSTFQRVNTPIREVKGAGEEQISIWNRTWIPTTPRATLETPMLVHMS